MLTLQSFVMVKSNKALQPMIGESKNKQTKSNTEGSWRLLFHKLGNLESYEPISHET